MNLVSCDCCGIVLDANKLRFPEDIYNNDGSIDTDKAAWNGDDYIPFVSCPICFTSILKDKR